MGTEFQVTIQIKTIYCGFVFVHLAFPQLPFNVHLQDYFNVHE